MKTQKTNGQNKQTSTKTESTVIKPHDHIEEKWVILFVQQSEAR